MRSLKISSERMEFLLKQGAAAVPLRKILLAEFMHKQAGYRALFVETFFHPQRPARTKHNVFYDTYGVKIAPGNVWLFAKKINAIAGTGLIKKSEGDLKHIRTQKKQLIFMNPQANVIVNTKIASSFMWVEPYFRPVADSVFYRIYWALQFLAIYEFDNNTGKKLEKRFKREVPTLEKLKQKLFAVLGDFEKCFNFITLDSDAWDDALCEKYAPKITFSAKDVHLTEPELERQRKKFKWLSSPGYGMQLIDATAEAIEQDFNAPR